MVTLWSGIHTGAESPRMSPAPWTVAPGWDSWGETKLAFLPLYSSIALLMASTQSFLSATSLKLYWIVIILSIRVKSNPKGPVEIRKKLVGCLLYVVLGH